MTTDGISLGVIGLFLFQTGMKNSDLDLSRGKVDISGNSHTTSIHVSHGNSEKVKKKLARSSTHW